MTKAFMLMAWVLIFGVSCTSPEKSTETYFPLPKGGRWNLISEQWHETRIVKGSKTIEGFEYAFVDFSYHRADAKDERNLAETRFLRVDINGNLHEYIDSSHFTVDKLSMEIAHERGIELSSHQLLYRPAAKIGENWSVFASHGLIRLDNKPILELVNVTLESNSDTVYTRSGAIFPCLRFRLRYENTTDVDYWEWYAKGIGIVKKKLISGTTFVLNKDDE